MPIKVLNCTPARTMYSCEYFKPLSSAAPVKERRAFWLLDSAFLPTGKRKPVGSGERHCLSLRFCCRSAKRLAPFPVLLLPFCQETDAVPRASAAILSNDSCLSLCARPRTCDGPTLRPLSLRFCCHSVKNLMPYPAHLLRFSQKTDAFHYASAAGSTRVRRCGTTGSSGTSS